jgi:hypothetical protein
LLKPIDRRKAFIAIAALLVTATFMISLAWPPFSYPLRFELGMALSTSATFAPTDYRLSAVDYAHANSFSDTMESGM